MNLDKHELKLLTAAVLMDGGRAQPIAVEGLAGLFDRPARLHKTVAGLNRCGAILHDPYQGTFLIRAQVIWNMLNEHGGQAELFTQERPLDAALASASRLGQSSPVATVPVVPVRNDTDLCEITQRMTKLQAQFLSEKTGCGQGPPGAETSGIPGVSHEFMPHAPHASMPVSVMPSKQPLHVHESCNSGGIKKLHGMSHEVGELGRRTTAEMMAEIRALAPGLAPEFLEQWQARIEREDAAVVNACIRQAKLQRRNIRNMAAWLNRCYLNAVLKQPAGKEKTI